MNLVNLPVMPDYGSEQQLFAAVVNTLTEFDSIETVSIFLNGCNDITANGSLPPQKHGKYALNVENAEIATSGSAKPLTLYFPNESGPDDSHNTLRGGAARIYTPVYSSLQRERICAGFAAVFRKTRLFSERLSKTAF